MLFKTVCCAFFAIVLSAEAWANDGSDFVLWKENFRQEALANGVSEPTLNKFLPRMQLLPQVIKADRKQPEFLSTFWEYTDARLTTARIEKGKMLLKRYPTWLKRISDKYRVPREFILAFWGLETNYGNYMGNTDVLNALTTLAYNPRRRTFFTRELIAFLKILEQEKWESVTGSWAGAFGHFQFMPTTFEAYAVDADNNGSRNLVKNMPDAFASAANYLHQMGWNPNQTWGQEVFLPKKLNWRKVYETPEKTITEWVALGLMPAHQGWYAAPETKASLIMPMGKNGPAFLTYPNFKRVMRWNKSELYALTVCFLADILADKWQGIAHERIDQRLSTEEVYQIQQRLADLGYYEFRPDGLVGQKTRRAILAFQQEKELDEDGYPSKELLYLLNTCGKELK